MMRKKKWIYTKITLIIIILNFRWFRAKTLILWVYRKVPSMCISIDFLFIIIFLLFIQIVAEVHLITGLFLANVFKYTSDRHWPLSYPKVTVKPSLKKQFYICCFIFTKFIFIYLFINLRILINNIKLFLHWLEIIKHFIYLIYV